MIIMSMKQLTSALLAERVSAIIRRNLYLTIDSKKNIYNN